jgi:anti-sigma-K factor RskA
MTDAGRHPRDAEAFEYALGSGSREERQAFSRELERDPGLAAAVRYWDERLAALAAAIPPQAPSDGLLDAISSRLEAGASPNAGNVVDIGEVIRLRRSRAVWRSIAAGAGSLAAALALWVAAERFPPRSQESGLVAVVNRSGDLPALIVRVDQRAGVVQVRAVAMEAPSGRALELWSVAQGGAPRSLGLVASGMTRTPMPRDRGLAEGVTLAVSVEPPGGSPTGSPTGPVIYSGRLIPEAP